MTRRKHYKIDDLPENVRTIVDEALAKTEGRRPRYREIQQTILEKTGKRVSVSSLSRYYQGRIKEDLEAAKAEAERRQAEVTAIRDTLTAYPNCNDQELVERLVQVGLLVNDMRLEEADPIRLLQAHKALELVKIERERMALERDKLVFQRQEFTEQVQLANRRLDLLKEKFGTALKTVEKASQKGRALTPEEIQKIREEVYGG